MKLFKKMTAASMSMMVVLVLALFAAIRTRQNLRQAAVGPTGTDPATLKNWSDVSWSIFFRVWALWFTTENWMKIGKTPLTLTGYTSYDASASDFLTKWVERSAHPAWMFWRYYTV